MERTRLPQGQGFYWNGDKENIYLQLWVAGKKFSYSTGTTSIKEAKKFRSQKLADLMNNASAQAKRGIRVQELFDDFIATLEQRERDRGKYSTFDPHASTSYKTQSQIDKNLKPVFGQLKPDQITTPLLNQYVKDRTDAGASRVTVNRELAYLRRAMRIGSQSTPKKVNPLLIPHFPIDVKAERLAAKTGTIDADTFDKLFVASADHFRPVLATVVHTGVRSKELKFIRPEQVDFEKNVIRLKLGETKEGSAREVPMNDFVKEVLLKWQEQTRRDFPKAAWFFHFEGKQVLSWKKAWTSALRRAGVEGVTFHDSRRTVVTRLDEAGVQEKDIQAVTGHKTTSMVRAYNQSKESVERVRVAQNAALGVTNAPATSKRDWKVLLQELKELLDGGLLPMDLYKIEVAKVLASR